MSGEDLVFEDFEGFSSGVESSLVSSISEGDELTIS